MAAENFATHQGADPTMELKVNSPNVEYTTDYITAQYNYEKNLVTIVGNTGIYLFFSVQLNSWSCCTFFIYFHF